MVDDLPNEFDLVVVGTGFIESCVAAAASRIGKTVLHIDRNEYYGSAWASFDLKKFNDILQNADINGHISNASINWLIPEQIEADQKTEIVEENAKTISNDETVHNWTQQQFNAATRSFSIDLVPRVLFSTGKLVKLLISSNICRYAEFRAVDRVCTMFADQVLSVPCSRSDVFNTHDLNIVEKRLLMKFLNQCLTMGEVKNGEDALAFRNNTFGEYLAAQNVTDKISTCVRQAIAMCGSDTDFLTGLQRTQLFLRSLGQYGNTPFLYPQYGNGELPQCFCRLCAVFGGIYYLQHDVQQIEKTADGTELVLHLDTGKAIRAKHVVMSRGSLTAPVSPIIVANEEHSLSRAVFIATTPLGDEEMNSGGGGVNLLRLVTKTEDREAILLQLAHFTGTCPKGIYLFHLTTEAKSDNPEADLQPFVQQIFLEKVNAPKFVYSAFFTLKAPQLSSASVTDSNERIFCTAAPQYEIDYELAINNARNIFSKLYGADTEFLPRAPDPEEIIIDGDDPSTLHAHELPEDLRAQLLALEQNVANMQMNDSEHCLHNEQEFNNVVEPMESE